MRRPLSLAEFGGCGLRERLVRSSARCTKRAPTSSDSRRRYVVVVASAGIPAGFFEIGPLSRASRRAKVPSVANVEESVVEATLCLLYLRRLCTTYVVFAEIMRLFAEIMRLFAEIMHLCR